MRLTQKEQEKIVTTLQQIYPGCEIYLFGSRVDDTKKGGDIDLFVIPKTKSFFEQKLTALYRLKQALLKPVDLVVSSNPSRSIEQEALLHGIKLL